MATKTSPLNKETLLRITAMKKWQPKTISATSNCPKKYCYFFIESGDSFAPGLYENLEEAMSKLQPIEQDGCIASLVFVRA